MEGVPGIRFGTGVGVIGIRHALARARGERLGEREGGVQRHPCLLRKSPGDSPLWLCSPGQGWVRRWPLVAIGGRWAERPARDSFSLNQRRLGGTGEGEGRGSKRQSVFRPLY